MGSKNLSNRITTTIIIITIIIPNSYYCYYYINPCQSISFLYWSSRTHLNLSLLTSFYRCLFQESDQPYWTIYLPLAQLASHSHTNYFLSLSFVSSAIASTPNATDTANSIFYPVLFYSAIRTTSCSQYTECITSALTNSLRSISSAHLYHHIILLLLHHLAQYHAHSH